MNVDQAKMILLKEAYRIYKSKNFIGGLGFDFHKICKDKKIPENICFEAIHRLEYFGLIYFHMDDNCHYLTTPGKSEIENLANERRNKWIERGWILGVTLLTSTIAGLLVYYLTKRIFHQPN